jgi:hypothetical protein
VNQAYAISTRTFLCPPAYPYACPSTLASRHTACRSACPLRVENAAHLYCVLCCIGSGLELLLENQPTCHPVRCTADGGPCAHYPPVQPHQQGPSTVSVANCRSYACVCLLTSVKQTPSLPFADGGPCAFSRNVAGCQPTPLHACLSD